MPQFPHLQNEIRVVVTSKGHCWESCTGGPMQRKATSTVQVLPVAVLLMMDLRAAFLLQVQHHQSSGSRGPPPAHLLCPCQPWEHIGTFHISGLHQTGVSLGPRVWSPRLIASLYRSSWPSALPVLGLCQPPSIMQMAQLAPQAIRGVEERSPS